MAHADLQSNLLLARVPAATLERFVEAGKIIAPPLSTIVIEQNERLDQVFFPLQGAVVSLTRSVEGGTTIEVGVIGSEGFAGIAAVLDRGRHLDRGMIQAEGALLRVPVGLVDEEIARGAEVRRPFFLYINAFLMQVAQTALCNRLHTIEARLARWLLMMQDRTQTAEMRLTQEFLSHMLGTRLAGVNEAVQSLERAALIGHARNRITVIDRPGLEETACECYRVVRDEFDRMRAESAAVTS